MSGIEKVELGRLEELRTLRQMFAGPYGVSTAALAALAGHVRAVRIPEGTTLHEADQPVSTVYLIIDGELASEYNGKLVYRFGRHEGLGLLPSLARKHSGFRAWATRETLALSWRVEDMLEVFEDHFELLYAVLRGLSQDAVDLRKQLPPHAGFSNDIRTALEYSGPKLDLVERILALRHTFGFESSHIDELAELARTAGEVRRPAGTRLWSAGDRSETILILMRGVVDCVTADGLSFRLGPGDIAGGLGAIAELPRWYEAIVVEPIVALTLSREVMVDQLEDQPDLGFDFLHQIAALLLDLRLRVAVHRERQGVLGPHPLSSSASVSSIDRGTVTP